MKTFGGNVLFLDRSDINTDEIIPAKYLNEPSKEALKPYLLEDLKLPGFDPCTIVTNKPRVVVTRANFGCGSSREHAPWAFEVNDITLVVAENFARIFRGNMFNCGMLAIELTASTIEQIFGLGKSGAVTCSVDIKTRKLMFSSDTKKIDIPFSLNAFDEALITSGGWVEYADAKY